MEGESALISLLRDRKIGPSQFNKAQLVLLSVILLFTIFPNSHSKVEAAQSKLKTIYHVYVDDQYIGKVNNQNKIDQLIEEKINESEYKDLNPFISEEITYVPEKSFNPRMDEGGVLEILQDLLTLKVEAHALKIDDEIIGYFENEEMIDNALRKYKQTFVNKKDLEKLKQKEDSLIFIDETLYLENKEEFIEGRDPLKPGSKELVDAFLDNEMEVFVDEIEPEKLLSEKEGFEHLNKGTIEEEKHAIKKGEILQTIAPQYDLTKEELLELNPDLSEDSILQIDQEITVSSYKPAYDVIAVEEKATEEKISYETEVIESDELYKGEEEIKQKGKNGKKEVLYAVTYKNGEEVSEEVLKEKIVKKPKKKIVIKGTKVIPSRGDGEYVWPTNGGYISSHYGHRWGRLHKGMDIARPSDRTIKAADHGVVSFAGYQGGFGNKIVIDHNNGMQTVYAHLSSIDVKPGQVVEKESAIGVMGSTGNSTGVHLHFEIHINGSPINPLQYF